LNLATVGRDTPHEENTMSFALLSPIVRDRLPYLGGVGIVLLLDRISKIVIQRAFDLGDQRSVIAGFFELVHVHNTGVAFGIFSGGESTAKAILLSGFAVAAAVTVVVYSVRTPVADWLLQVSLALILGGALGNLYDRVNYGYVIDFLNFHAGGYYWPAFNAADMAISLGVVCLAFNVIQDEIRDRS
jgi:signal peptidase II